MTRALLCLRGRGALGDTSQRVAGRLVRGCGLAGLRAARSGANTPLPSPSEPLLGGEWRAWYARLWILIEQYHDRADDAGRFTRRLLREMDSLWVFLAQQGVDATNNRAERALRFGVLWRKRSLGTASDKGNRWVERILSLRETCRLQATSTYTVLIEAMTRFFHGQPLDLSWITAGVSTASHPL